MISSSPSCALTSRRFSYSLPRSPEILSEESWRFLSWFTIWRRGFDPSTVRGKIASDKRRSSRYEGGTLSIDPRYFRPFRYRALSLSLSHSWRDSRPIYGRDDAHQLTSCAGTTCHARREFFVPKLQCFYNNIFEWSKIGRTNNKFINNFSTISIQSCRRVRKESDELLCTAWSLVMVRNQLSAQRCYRKRRNQMKSWDNDEQLLSFLLFLANQSLSSLFHYFLFGEKEMIFWFWHWRSIKT